MGIAFARNSNHFGPVAPYSYLAAEQGFASIIGSNASTTIAPTGGRQARLGNSPVAFAVPNPGGRPILLDMALSVAARAKIRNAAKTRRADSRNLGDGQGRQAHHRCECRARRLPPAHRRPQGLRTGAHRRSVRRIALGCGVPHPRELVVRAAGSSRQPRPLLPADRHEAPRSAGVARRAHERLRRHPPRDTGCRFREARAPSRRDRAEQSRAPAARRHRDRSGAGKS